MAILLRTIAVVLILSIAVHAATFVVNVEYDGHDANPGDGVAMTSRGDVTLRAAIEEANALPGKDVILFDPSGWFPSQHMGGENAWTAIGDELVITEDVDIINQYDYAVLMISSPGRPAHRIMRVESNVNVHFRRIGFYMGISENGAGLYVKPGANVEMEVCKFLSNAATDRGGGLYNDGGTVLIRGGSFDSCTAGIEGGGIYNHGGTIVLQPMNYRVSFLAFNSAGERGSAIYINGGSLIMDWPFISYNKPSHYGVVYLEQGDLYASRCLVYKNYHLPGLIGGGFFIAGGTARIVNSLFFENIVTEYGAGIAIQGGVTEIINCTHSCPKQRSVKLY